MRIRRLLIEMDTRIAAILLLAALNVAAFMLYGFDKHQAKAGGRRIPERWLLLWSVFGSVGAELGMIAFHHKTRKPLFHYGVPAILLAEVAIALYLLHTLHG